MLVIDCMRLGLGERVQIEVKAGVVHVRVVMELDWIGKRLGERVQHVSVSVP